MKKIDSYFDWELKFKKTSPPHSLEEDSEHTEIKLNSLNIEEKTFKSHLSAWRKKHLPL